VARDRWQRFCIVGLGKHARTKLIPALQANGQDIVGLVSRQDPGLLPCGPVFASVENALAALPADTAFVIATPPALHFEQARLAIACGRDVIVEKPAFVTGQQAGHIADLCAATGALLVEAMMYHHTMLHARLMALWRARRDDAVDLSISFLIPANPEGTFRQDGSIASSGLYDIGCYALSLLADLGLPLDDLALVRVDRPGQAREAIELAGTLDGVKATVRVGISDAYENQVSLGMADGATISCRPFFFGRPGDRRMVTERDGEAREERLTDGDAFQAMLNVPRSTWRESQARRLASVLSVTRRLSALGADLDAWRKRAADPSDGNVTLF
jgi:predicted dehydrogenase